MSPHTGCQNEEEASDLFITVRLKAVCVNKFWSTQELKCNWQVEITGTGSRSEVP